MLEQTRKNSKKGFSLPMAVAVSLFLVIISTSLIFIAIQSTSNTSVDISGRQAYLNIRSALEYARTYYSTNVKDYSVISTEYMYMKDIGGTTSEGAEITKNESVAAGYTTYVQAKYTKADNSNPATLKLTGFSKYSDIFGHKGKTAHLSVIFSVGSTGPNRLTIIAGDRGGESYSTTESITLNVKKPAGMNYEMTYYVWTYKDTGDAYHDYNEAKGDISYLYDSKVDVDKLNKTTMSANEIKPNAEWRLTDDAESQLAKGPNGIMADTGNGWFAGEYFIKSGRVPWFNIIFAKQYTVLNPYNKDGRSAWNIYDSQVNEIFHLWYLDPADKNVYFEFFDTKKTAKNEGYPNDDLEVGSKYYTKYYEGLKWDGRKGLEDTVLVYVKNPKTTVHFRVKGVDDTLTVPTMAAPVIDSVEVSGDPITGQSFLHSGNKKPGNITMEYEGCGWWVANIETNSNFNLTITANGFTKTARNIDANTVNNEFWIVYNSGSLNVHSSEETALLDIGVDPNSYVTVHAKIANYAKAASPKIGYSDVKLNSSSGKISLLNALIDAEQVNKDDYTAESYAVLKAAMVEGYKQITDENFIKNQPGPSDADKIKQADKLYNATRQKILKAVGDLQSIVDPDSINELDQLVKSATKKVNDKRNYDMNAYNDFVRSTPASKKSAYVKAVEALADSDSLEKNIVTKLYDELNSAIMVLDSNYIGTDRSNLESKLETLRKFKGSDQYEKEYVEKFDQAFDLAQEVSNRDEVLKNELTNALNKLEEAYNELTAHQKSVLDLSRLNALKSEADAMLSAGTSNTLENCTQKTFNALKTARDNANEINSIKEQSGIDALADALQTAINDFTVTKPVDTNDKLKYKDNTIRIWVQNKDKYAFEVEQYFNDTTSTPISGADFTEWYPGSTFSYYNLDMTYVQKIILSTKAIEGDNVGEVYGSTSEIVLDEVKDNNLVIVIDDKGKPTVGQLVTVYGKFRGDTVKPKIGKVVAESVYEEPYLVSRYIRTNANKDDKFTVVGLNQKLDGDGSQLVTEQITYIVGKLAAGEYVATYKTADADKTSIACTAVKTADIFPKYGDNATPQGEPSNEGNNPQGTFAADEYEIVNMGNSAADYIYFTDSEWDNIKWGSNARACFYNNSGNEVGTTWPGYTMSSYSVDSDGNMRYKVIPPAGATQVIFNNINSQQSERRTFKLGYGYSKGTYKGESYGKKTFATTEWGPVAIDTSDDVEFESGYVYITNNKNWNNLHIYFFNSSGAVGASWPGYELDYHGKNDQNEAVYKAHPPKGATSLIINNADDTNQTVNVTFTIGKGYWISGGSGKFHTVTEWTVNGGGGGGGGGDDEGGGGTYDKEGYKEKDLANVNLPMAYVGGNKVRVQNKSYKDIYGDNRKTNSNGETGNYIRSDNPFGGTNGAGGNNDSAARLGAAELTAYYDWYEFKLPISHEAEYTFALSGMDPDHPSVQTKIVKDAHGDVWLEQLSNYNGGSGHFQNINLYTFNPEESQISEKLTVYFRLPNGWTNPTIAVSGPFKDAVSESLTKSLGEHNGILYLDNIDRNTPFITFNVTDDEGVTHEYKTSLQGNDYSLFDPSANNKYGEWEYFLSYRDQLKRTISLLRSTYFGSSIASNYNDQGELADGATRYYSKGLLALYSNYSEKHSMGGFDYYITKNVDDYTETQARTALNSIETSLGYYKALYNAILNTRQYLDNPLTDTDMANSNKSTEYDNIHGNGGGHYPEYYTKAVKTRQYTQSSINYLRKRMAEAEEVFLSNSSDTALKNAIDGLKRAVANLETKSEGSIACVLFDAQGKVRDGSKFYIRFTTDSSQTNREKYTKLPVKEYNPERYPIIFLSGADVNHKNTIYNVQFLEERKTGGDPIPLGSEKPQMDMDDAWVFVDTASTPYWSKNTASDYREINAELFQMDNASDKQIYQMKETSPGSGTYLPMTLLFSKDAEIRDASGNLMFIIKAGSYYFDSSSIEDPDSPAYSTGTVDLFKSKAYFENVALQGEYVVGEKDLNDNTVSRVLNADGVWHKDDDFVTGTNNVVGKYVNLEASKGELTKYAPYYSYSTTEGLYFRWSSEDPLYTSTRVKLYASEYKFATMGTIDGTKKGTRNPKFELYCSDSTANEMRVEFRTDVYVKYYDDRGELHRFAIREGIYVIEKANKNASGPIANLYDERYWKSMEHVTFIGKGTAAEGGSGSYSNLQNGTYVD